MTLGWTDDGSQVTVMATLPGDTDLSSGVDGTDLFNLLGNYGAAANWAGGDTDYSGAIDGTGVAQWQVTVKIGFVVED